MYNNNDVDICTVYIYVCTSYMYTSLHTMYCGGEPELAVW